MSTIKQFAGTISANFHQLKTNLYDFQFIFDDDWRQDMVIKFAEYKVNIP